MSNDIRKHIMLIENIILDESFKVVQQKFPTTANPNKGRYVYHVSDKLFKDIRALEYQVGKNKKDYTLVVDVDNYFKEVNAFLGVVLKKDVELLRRNGFVNWGTGKLYREIMDS